MQNTTQTRWLTMVGIVVLLATAGVASGPAAKSTPTTWGYDFHAVVPLGHDVLRLEPAKKIVCLLASAEAIGFEGLQRREDESGRVLVTSANGDAVKHYPEVIDFRVTASARKKKPADDDVAPYPVQANREVNDYLLGLKFRVVIFHGLEARVLEPAAIKLIGVPADVPYDERVFRVSFNVGKVAVEDRMVLEVLDPDGNRVSKFSLIVG